ncbi:MAG: pyridoxamine 5'-phosphate oxidase family protein [Vallitalea sp.]|jgi:nitroimidazol reductase NimA-like FMN-containing flavoprotein (pyridoxamine 5'-phosphate oxidase superfamily)|nr:pyridoxamine 5'-phosphate oxidase family protein [Vallitalea sp.]
MFREMRRKKQLIPMEQAEAILRKRTSGVFIVNGDDGYPYGVPISYIYHDKKIYMHSAKSGHKIDAILNNNKASFTVIDKDDVIPTEFTTYFRSVICFGKARIIDDDSEKLESLKLLTRKYSPNLEKEMNEEIRSGFKALTMIVLEIEHITGKQSIKLMEN